MMRYPLDPYAAAVDNLRRWTVDWYAWLIELVGDVNVLQVKMATVEASQLVGTVTFAAATTAAVTFGTNQPDASYSVVVDSSEDNYFWTTAKAVGGFTLNAKNSSSATVSWILLR